MVIIMPEVTVAKLAGFCFGVNRAVNTVKAAIDGTSHVYTLGKLIHNPGFLNSLAEKGVKIISADELESIFNETNEQNRTVICTRAHGITRELTEKFLPATGHEPTIVHLVGE